jgi:protocatechuate 3,4-dioxygenase beta subunit
MKRKDFLKSLGFAGVAAAVPVGKAVQTAIAQKPKPLHSVTGEELCTLIPSETAGPFPLDLTENSTFFRQDIRESKTGVQLNVKMKIIGVNNCLPMANVRVNIWHCDKDGLYSGYSQNNNPGQAGLTYLRGYQITDANGEVNFVTIFPGWYTGRICHIHFQAYVSPVYAAISQMTFPIATKNALYAANSGLYTKGADPLSFNSDNIFSDGYEFQLATLTPNTTTGGYDAYLEVAIQGDGVSGLSELEPSTGGQFKLGQNFPNPYSDETTVPFVLHTASAVRLRLFDLQGRQGAEIDAGKLGVGEQQIVVNMKQLGLPTSTYAYQLDVENNNGKFHSSRLMTAL